MGEMRQLTESRTVVEEHNGPRLPFDTTLEIVPSNHVADEEFYEHLGVGCLISLGTSNLIDLIQDLF